MTPRPPDIPRGRALVWGLLPDSTRSGQAFPFVGHFCSALTDRHIYPTGSFNFDWCVFTSISLVIEHLGKHLHDQNPAVTEHRYLPVAFRHNFQKDTLIFRQPFFLFPSH